MKVFNSISNSLVDSEIYSAADLLVKLRNTKGMWEVIDEVLNIWHKNHPKEWKAHLIDIKDLRDTRKNEFASTKDKSLRLVLDIPEKIILMIRKLYDVQECPMDKKWMLKFAKRYPNMVVAEKL
ncbi:MAG: hypothetical protein UR46_C0020G0003 [Parcubacteria group bacterium GW2011_GWA1_33_6]|nr:MAG: hypothetical protein UR46_C0020G0003 [Parcubacteria group bacterium GW2011_GWA1_33_6]